MDMLDSAFQQLYAAFVEQGGLDQTDHIVDEDFERIERAQAFCSHSVPRRSCPFCGRKNAPNYGQ